MILQIKNIKENKIDFNLDAEFNKVIAYERNRQLKQYSSIYFNKIKKNLGFSE
jgi:peptidyl-prolyl cis-trans isomerase SurA